MNAGHAAAAASLAREGLRDRLTEAGCHSS